MRIIKLIVNRVVDRKETRLELCERLRVFMTAISPVVVSPAPQEKCQRGCNSYIREEVLTCELSPQTASPTITNRQATNLMAA